MADFVNYNDEVIEQKLCVKPGTEEDSNHGLMCPADKAKLDGIQDRAEENQNAFSHINVINGQSNKIINADKKKDTFNLKAGDNISIDVKTTVNASDNTINDDEITITAAMYTHPSHNKANLNLYKVEVDEEGHISATESVGKDYFTTDIGLPSEDTNTTYSLTASKNSTDGNVKLTLTPGGTDQGRVPDNISINGSGATTVTTDANGVITVSSTDTKVSKNDITSLLGTASDGIATNDKAGLVKIGFTKDDTNKKYPVELDNGKMYVQVPWTDTNTDADNKVTNTPNNTTKAYITGTTSNTENTGTQIFDTKVYLDTTAGRLCAHSMSVDDSFYAGDWAAFYESGNYTYVTGSSAEEGIRIGDNTSYKTGSILGLYDKNTKTYKEVSTVEYVDSVVSGMNTSYTLPTATSSALGGVKIGYAASGKNYAVQLDSNSKMYVNVPWTDTNTFKLNNSSQSLNTTFYAPTTLKGSTYFLAGNASGGIPEWKPRNEVTATLYNMTSGGKMVTWVYDADGDETNGTKNLYFRPGDGTSADTSFNCHLGGSSARWTTIYGKNGKFSGTMDITGITTISARIQPSSNESINCGYSNAKWMNVYTKNCVSGTSDLNMKKDINPIDDRYINLFDIVQPYTFMFKNGDRIHTGFIAQYIEEAMGQVGLTAEELGFFCKDIKTEPVYDDRGNYIEDKPVYDDEGNPIYIYSIRHGEYVAIIAEKIKRMESKYNKEINTVKEENATLRKELEDLKELINSLI